MHLHRPFFLSLQFVTDNGEERSWEMYRNQEIGIEMRYLSSMSVESNAEPPSVARGVEFMLTGPTQEENTELFDGIRFVVWRGAHEEAFRSFVEQNLEDARRLGSVTKPLSEASLAGRDALMYAASTLGEHTHYYLDLEGNTYLHVLYSHPDPTGQGYADVTAEMLESIRLLP